MEQEWRSAPRPFAALLAAPAAWLLAFFVVPMAIVWAYSFGETAGLTGIALTGTGANYARALDPLYLEVLARSAGIAALATLLCLVAGCPIALAIAFAPPRAKAWLLMLVMLPFWTNLLVRTYALMAMLRTEGFLNAALGQVGIGPLPLLHNDFAVIVGLVYVNLPFLVLPVYAALDRLDRSLVEASLDLGASQLRTMREIVVPLALPGIVTGVIVTFVPALGSYLAPDLLGGPDSQMIANVIERQFKRANDWPFGAALSFLLIYLTFVAVAGQAFLARRRKATR